MSNTENRLRGLYAITPDWADTAQLLARVGDCLAGGARLLQYRNKIADALLRRRQAEAILARCRDAGVPLIINDDAALAHELGADGVHLGRDDGSPETARKIVGPAAIVGISCYNDLDNARGAARDGATYLAFGAAYASRTKPDAAHAPLALFRRAAKEFGLPIAAIGGITPNNAPALIAAGVDLVAVISDLFDAADSAERAAQYAALF